MGYFQGQRLRSRCEGRSSEQGTSRQSEAVPVQDQAYEGGIRQGVRQEARRNLRQEGQKQIRTSAADQGRHRKFQKDLAGFASGDLLVRVDGSVYPAGRCAFDSGETYRGDEEQP